MPRIRTIKPEFWRNKPMAKVSYFTRLLAIALLNMADDEGYFEADEDLIRGDCFPYEKDSVSIHGGLTELSVMGYIQLRESSNKGKIGLVCKFKEHQKINRPTPSKLAKHFNESTVISLVETQFTEDSLRTHGAVTEDSRQEQGKGTGKGNREQGEGKQNQDPVSEVVAKRSNAFQATWRLWKNHQREKFNVLTPTSEEMALMELERCFPGNESEQIKAIEFSIVRGAKNLITNGDHRKQTASTDPIKSSGQQFWERALAND